jgi:hypothetical protein
MFRKFLKFGLIGTGGLLATAFVFPDHFTPVQKVLNVGIAGAQVYYVYKYQTGQIRITKEH